MLTPIDFPAPSGKAIADPDDNLYGGGVHVKPVEKNDNRRTHEDVDINDRDEETTND